MDENKKLTAIFHEGEIKAIVAVLTRIEKRCMNNIQKVFNQGERGGDYDKEAEWLGWAQHYKQLREPFETPAESVWAQVYRNELCEALAIELNRSFRSSDLVSGLLAALIYKIEDL